ncbi:carboxypeptidase regulatory-like domain-containing protein [bacterium]|nr:carboxypeptidase regulatory-like domain-containing protein [bacterium]
MRCALQTLYSRRTLLLLGLALLFVGACASGRLAAIETRSLDTATMQPGGLPPLPVDLPELRAAQSVDVTTQRGQDAFTTTAGCTPDGADALLISAGAGGLEYAMYQFSPGAATLSSVLATLSFPAGEQVWIGLADYGSFRWKLQGPYPAAGTAQFSGLGSGDYVNAGGNCYFLVLAFNASSVSVSSVEFTAETAPETFTINGMVIDGAGPGVLPGVTVTLSPGGATVLTTVNGTYQFSGLAAGTYTVTPSLIGYGFVPESSQVTIGPSANGIDFAGFSDLPTVSYSSDIAPIMESYCTGCHDADTPSADIPLTTYQEVKSAAASSLSTMQDESMPPGPNKPSAAEIQLFQDWIDAGKPQ